MSILNPEIKTSVKLIDANGQISLGKEYAGRQVLVEERELGVWFARIAIIIPENERWLHEPRAAADLKAALDWAATTKAQTANIETLFNRPNGGKQSTRQARKTGSQPSRVSKKPA